MRIILVLFLCLVTVQAFAIRDKNITDEEVHQIKAAVSSFSKGDINYIGVVKDYCRCMNGPGCKATVDITVKSPSETNLYELSQIKGVWQVGAKLQYALDYKKLKKRIGLANRENDENALANLLKEKKLLGERFQKLKKSCDKALYRTP